MPDNTKVQLPEYASLLPRWEALLVTQAAFMCLSTLSVHSV